jgi:serine/threonine protein kinase/tetratricopeptide (TPR) repeat protein
MVTVNETVINKRYRLDEEIGRGGMGTVFRGWDMLLQRDVAIKLLSSELLGRGGADRLINEAIITARLDHPNIVTLYDAGKVEEGPYIVMQYIKGETLADYQPTSIDDSITISIQICSALSHAHSNGVIHRDLKPENVFIIPFEAIDGEPITPQIKIVDFGIAHSDLANMTIEGEISGTVSYMAPEQALGQDTSPQTDLYALGVLLYELVTGELPYVGDNPLSVISQHINAPVKAPSRINSQIPHEMDNLIISLMSKSSGDRPTSAHEVELALIGQLSPGIDIDRVEISARLPRSVKHNLPAQLTSFIGREQEIEEIGQLIDQDDCRLLTLLGPGGIGKTRLALEVAAGNLSDYPDGTYFIPLASVSSADFILTSVAEALDFSIDTHSSEFDAQTQLFDYLEDQTTLLVLDNYEHLIDGSTFLMDLLQRAPRVKMLVTSRERLNLQGEWIFNLHGLEYPENGSTDGDVESSAVELFLTRARNADAKFTLTEDQRQHVNHVCQLVEGVPLGIELAAVWISMLTPQEIAGEIEKNIDFLATSLQDVPEKHRSVRAAFDYSWQLLSEEQRLLFSKLSIFRGGFLRQAAEFVAQATIQDLSALVDKSLLQRTDLGRYQIHELLRQYAEERLNAYPEANEIRGIHADYYFVLLNDKSKDLIGEGQIEASNEVQAEIANINSALEWGITYDNVERILTAFPVLKDYYFLQGYFDGSEAFKHFAQVVDNHYHCGYDPAKTGSALYFSALAYRCYFLSFLGAADNSDEIINKIIPGIIVLAMQQEYLICVECLGINSSLQGDYEDAEGHLKESRKISEELNDLMTLGGSQIWLGWVYYEKGDYELSRQEWIDAQSVSLEMNNRLLLAFVQSKLALLEDELGNYETAIKIQLDTREIFKHFGDRAGIGYANSRLSYTLNNMGEFSEAKRSGREGLQYFKEVNHRWGIPASYCRIGFAEIGLGEYESAWGHFTEALNLAQQSQILSLILYALIGIADLLARHGEYEQGIIILYYVTSHSATPVTYKDIADKVLSDVEGDISDQELERLQDKGRESELQGIIDLIPDELVESHLA